ncbi:MAG: carboxynorspermidine decarboxylase [Elusimicrobia bacterium]|nr:carboxynorspermidine decarboxylase [Elusimicrobiota bacterium]
MNLETPYYLIDESKLLKNLEKIAYVREQSGAKSLLALKCFASWCVFDLMKKYMDGTTSSSLFEAKLGHEKFGKETHAYSVAFSDKDIEELKKISDKFIFNSISQLKNFYNKVKHKKVGLRVNPNFSYSHFDLADPARKGSKLGVTSLEAVKEVSEMISGAMFHYNCENDDYENFSFLLDRLGHDYGFLLEKLEWVSLGGGFYFTKENYPIEKFALKLKEFSEQYKIQVYLEPGEAAITNSASLVVKVLDIIQNNAELAIVDSSVEAHMLDLLIYKISAKMKNSSSGKYAYTIAGKSCLAGDIFGDFSFDAPLSVGTILEFEDAAGYTLVKKNWFNGLQMPSIVVKKLNGTVEIAKRFNYDDFKNNLS